MSTTETDTSTDAEAAAASVADTRRGIDRRSLLLLGAAGAGGVALGRWSAATGDSEPKGTRIEGRLEGMDLPRGLTVGGQEVTVSTGAIIRAPGGASSLEALTLGRPVALVGETRGSTFYAVGVWQ